MHGPGRRRRLAGTALAVVVLLLGAWGGQQALTRDRLGPMPTVGVQFHATWDSYTRGDRQTVLERMSDAGLSAVRIDVSWARVQPDGPGPLDEEGLERIDEVVDQSVAAGMDVLVMFWLTPAWANDGAGERVPPDDPATFADALARMAERYEGRVDAWEVWNEPNDEAFFVGSSPRRYAELLQASDEAMEGRSDAPVVFGGVQHADDAWVAQALAAGAAGAYDVMAVHPYPGVADLAPDAPADGTPYTFVHLRAVIDAMRRHGDGEKPVWITEIGWSTHPTADDAENWQQGVDEETQAAHSVATLDLVRQQFPEVEAVFYYAERDREPDSDDHIDNFGLLDAALTPKPVLPALSDAVDDGGGSPPLVG